MKKLLVLSSVLISFILLGCTTDKVTPKTSPMITFMDFVNKTKCEYVAQDDVYIESSEETVPGFILKLNDFSLGSMTNCVHSYQTQMNLNSWGLIYKAKRGTGRVMKINDKFQNQGGINVIVIFKVDDKYVSSSDEIFDLSKVNQIDFEVTSISGREIVTPTYTGGNVWYRRSK